MVFTDALTLLSDSGESEHDDDVACEASSSKRPRVDTTVVAFEDLAQAGYKPAELLESAAYLQDAAGQHERAMIMRPAAAAVATPASAEEVDATADGMKEKGDATDNLAHGCEMDAPDNLAQGCEMPRGEDTVKVLQFRGSQRPIPPPWRSFGGPDIPSEQQACLPRSLWEPLSLEGLWKPTPIQSYALPLLGMGRDLIGIAQTGSGKTLAYLLPCLARLLEPSVSTGTVGLPAILILGPTRELVCQIEKQADRFRAAADIRVASVYGGAPKAAQIAGLRSKPNVVVATPGRLLDFLETAEATCSVRSVRFLVIDEADRMLDEGFEEQIRKIVEQISTRHRQTMMFSATWPIRVQEFAEEFLRDAVEVHVGNTAQLQANPNIVQDVMFVKETPEKPEALVSYLNNRPHARVIVFVATKRTCRDLERCLAGRIRGSCASINGDKNQQEREAALRAFREDQVRVLFATDVASRGLDIPSVSLVVNFDPPRSAEDYIHRIGRTGRAGDSGLAISILSNSDVASMQLIAGVIGSTPGLRMPPGLASRLGILREAGKQAVVDPRAPWREPWEGGASTRLKDGDLSNAVAKLWP